MIDQLDMFASQPERPDTCPIKHEGMAGFYRLYKERLNTHRQHKQIQELEAGIRGIEMLQKAFELAGIEFKEDLVESEFIKFGYVVNHETGEGPRENPTKLERIYIYRWIARSGYGHIDHCVVVGKKDGGRKLIKWADPGIVLKSEEKDWKLNIIQSTDLNLKYCVYLDFGEVSWWWSIDNDGNWKLTNKTGCIIDKSSWGWSIHPAKINEQTIANGFRYQDFKELEADVQKAMEEGEVDSFWDVDGSYQLKKEQYEQGLR